MKTKSESIYCFFKNVSGRQEEMLGEGLIGMSKNGY